MTETAAGAPSATPRGRPNPGAALVAQINEGKARREKRKDVRPLAGLAPFIGAHGGLAAAAFTFLLISTSMTLSLTGAGRLVLDHGFGAGSAEVLNRYFLALAGVAGVLAIATAGRAYFINRLGERVVADIRAALYGHILTLDQAYFLDTRTGEVLSRLTTDTAIVETMVGVQSSVALRNVLTLIGSLIIMLFVSLKLTLCVLLVGPLVLIPLVLFGRRVRRLSAHAQDRLADAVGYAGESLDQLDTVQAFGREMDAAARFRTAVETAFSASQRRAKARAVLTVCVMAFVFWGVVAVLWFGAQAVKTHQMSPGALFQFIILSVLAAGAVGALGEVWGEVQK
ncbi:MAG: ABC transporter transmembrane domain-containing protein, partial [Caulobacteraceae bacterium]